MGCSTGARQYAGDLVRLSADHPGAMVLAAGPTFEEFSEVAAKQGREFVCASGGRRNSWEVCLVLGNGVLAVVPFGVPSGLTGVIEGAALVEAVSIRLDRGAIGIAGLDHGVTLTLSLRGETVGSVRGP